MSTLETRVDKLEQADAAARGIIVFTKREDETFVRWREGAPVNYRDGINGIFDAVPAQDVYTQAQLDTLEREGWTCIIVTYTHDWRAGAEAITE